MENDYYTVYDDDKQKIAKNYGAFKAAIAQHDQANPTHEAYGIGLSFFDMKRLGFVDGETLFAGICIYTDNGCTGNFRVLCDGDHTEQSTVVVSQQKEMVNA